MSPQESDQQSSADFALTVHAVHAVHHEPTSTSADEPSSEPEPEQLPLYKHVWKRWCEFYTVNSFLILVICAILLAYAYPPLGAVYVAPQITATWIAVMFIFSECLLFIS
eukprot:scaffold11031_cov75-Cyclotella_meneghiniana.AAC.5